ncbi:MAG TPA: alpha/beta hydrolase [Fimbriiglobus sp.]|jgi:acetyl esterase/lipase|nr:alpha/beta hydrolase [Fimbriiglobus sp.]
MLTAPLLVAAFALGQPPARTVVPLWEEKAPLAVGDSDADKPGLTVHLAPKDKATGAAVVICPGGGYGFLAADHEGEQVAKFFNGLGVHAFVLKYRIVTKDRPGPLGKAPLLDAQRAIRFVRAKAADHGIDLKKVGICGFSAGGHLTSTAATHFDEGDAAAADPIDRAGCRPDFCVLGYPVISMEDGVTHGGSKRNLLGAKPDPKLVEEFSNEKQVTAKTPPTFIFQTDEDTAVPAENAVRFYLALRKAKVPTELHVYEKGVHGVGLGRDPKSTKGSTYTEGWPDRLAAWLRLHKVAK